MIVIVGIAGSGKSVQSELLSNKLGCAWVGTGKLLRAAKLSDEIQQKMLSGALLDDAITFAVLEEEFERIDAKHNEFILDGSPRSVKQVEWLVDKINRGDLKMTAVIHLVASENIAEDRLIKRGRVDDHKDAIAERFSEYEHVIRPIIEYFRANGIEVHDINGEQPAEEVQNQILNIIE